MLPPCLRLEPVTVAFCPAPIHYLIMKISAPLVIHCRVKLGCGGKMCYWREQAAANTGKIKGGRKGSCNQPWQSHDRVSTDGALAKQTDRST
jgi:hypothetical protein